MISIGLCHVDFQSRLFKPSNLASRPLHQRYSCYHMIVIMWAVRLSLADEEADMASQAILCFSSSLQWCQHVSVHTLFHGHQTPSHFLPKIDYCFCLFFSATFCQFWAHVPCTVCFCVHAFCVQINQEEEKRREYSSDGFNNQLKRSYLSDSCYIFLAYL